METTVRNLAREYHIQTCNVMTGSRLGFSVVFNFRLSPVADQCFLRDGWRDFLPYFSDLCNPLSFCCLSRSFTPHHSA